MAYASSQAGLREPEGTLYVIRPDDDDKPFVARWNTLIRILLVDSSVKLVARTVMDYADFHDGTSCFPSNERIERDTGLGDKTIRNAWALLRAAGLAERVSHAVAHQRLADEYELAIPEYWKGLPILGPNGRKFVCLNCGKQINPQGSGEVTREGKATWSLWKAVFCPAPRKVKGRADVSCYHEWNRQQEKAGKRPWPAQGADAWKLFRQSRGDDW